MSSFIDQPEIPSSSEEATTVETTMPQQLQPEDSEERSRFQPILQYEPEITPQIEMTPASPTTALDTMKVRNGGVESFTGPWLPPRAKKLLAKANAASLSTSELIRLMEMIANRSIAYFDLPPGKFAAITFSGKIVELTDTKLDLLRKIQGVKYPEQIFVWNVGSDSFSGRI